MGAASATSYLPTTMEIRDLLGGLLGREVTLTPAPPLLPSASDPRSVAVFVDDSQAVRAVIVCDLGFSAYAGAALALLPVPVAQEAIEAKALDETLTETLYEVLNVAAALFNVGEAAHVRLLELHPAGPALPAAVTGRMLTLGRREDLEVTVTGYGTGRMSVVLC